MAVATAPAPVENRQSGSGVTDLHAEYRRTGARHLRDSLVARHTPLAHALANRFGPRGIQSEDDVLQVAFVGLIKAVDRFDPGLGYQFATFATKTILGELKRNLRDNDWTVRPSRSVHDLYLAVEACVDSLAQELGRRPTMDEVAEQLGVSVERIVEARDCASLRRGRSLDQPRRFDEPPLTEVLADPTDLFRRVEDQATLSRLMHQLSPPDRRIMAMRFVEGMSQAAIAEELGVSQMHVSRTLRTILNRLRAALVAA